MAPLASLDDVAHALGLENQAALGADQVFRCGPLLTKISREFRREAGCQFSPGRTKVRLLTVAGRVSLPDGLGEDGEVHSVTGIDGLSWTVDDDELVLAARCGVGTGRRVTVDYTHNEPVPEEVVATVAAIVVRYLSVDPTSAVAQSTFLGSEHFQQRFADWVSSSVKLTGDDCDFARSYRSRPVTVIVQRP